MNTGYGQLYQRAYTGSLVGSGAMVFAVWPYVIANTNPRNSLVELNATVLATILGEPVERVEEAIERLCQPDPRSRTKTEGGRRLIKRDEFTYFVVNFAYYRDIHRRDERNAYQAELMARRRTQEKLTSANSKLTHANLHVGVGAGVSESVPGGGDGGGPPSGVPPDTSDDPPPREPGNLATVDADPLPAPAPEQNAAAGRIWQTFRTRAGLTEHDHNRGIVIAQIVECLLRGYSEATLAEVARWATSTESAKLRGRPQRPTNVFDSSRLGQWLATIQTHRAELQLQQEKSRMRR